MLKRPLILQQRHKQNAGIPRVRPNQIFNCWLSHNTSLLQQYTSITFMPQWKVQHRAKWKFFAF